MHDRRAQLYGGDHDNRFSAGYFQLVPNRNHGAAQENGNIRREERGMEAGKNWPRMAERDAEHGPQIELYLRMMMCFSSMLCMG